jgi:hypothetical protein
VPERRFPPPWSVDGLNMNLVQDCYIVRDAITQRVPGLLHQDYDGPRSAGGEVSWILRKKIFGCVIGSEGCELLSGLLRSRTKTSSLL